MLQLKNITKQYSTGAFNVSALKNINISFRESEFVSVLGHSGSGKTTLLNIIGGLDQYTDGDLVINGVSTKKYKDRDWDIYRNHSVGFVFQSYNLIPHQTVLANVELALTLSGVTPKERRARAAEALDKVGLSEHIHKKPNQLSGGQMQRVAIARALINNPDILLADEPTGALDTDTSLQVMELLKKISEEKLVIMVTHNPELAENYSTRIVRLIDGEITDDTDPYSPNDITPAVISRKRTRGRSMSLFTAMSLSLNNLMTKKARTIMTSFAGSIGIMGIALILSVSAGFQTYIDQIQEDTLSTYPLTIQSETVDITSMVLGAAAQKTETKAETNEGDIVTEREMVSSMFARIGTNNIAAFKAYYEAHKSELTGSVNTVQYGYSITPQIYSSDFTYGVLRLNPSSTLSVRGISSGVFTEMLDKRELLDSQYDVLAGKWPENYDEVILVLADRGGISDYMVYSLGLRDPKELNEMVTKAMKGEEVELTNELKSWQYTDFLDMSFSLVSFCDYYKYNAEYDVWEDMSNDEDYMKDLVRGSTKLKLVGVVCPKSGVSASALSPGIAYTGKLTEYVINTSASKTIVKSQLANMDTDVFTGRAFSEIEREDEDRGLNFNDMITIDTDMLSSAFGMKINQADIQALMGSYMGNISTSITTDTSAAITAFGDTFETIYKGFLENYLGLYADPITKVASIAPADVSSAVTAYTGNPEFTVAVAKLSSEYFIPAEVLTATYKSLLNAMFGGYVSGYIAANPSVSAAKLQASQVQGLLDDAAASPLIIQTSAQMGKAMTEAKMQKDILGYVSELSTKLLSSVAGSFNVDAAKIAAAFKFNLDEDELTRLMKAYTDPSDTATAEGNLRKLGYADEAEPTSMSIYLTDFTGKEKFISFLESYNDKMKNEGHDEDVISYTDLTGILMSSVKTIVDSVSYVLIAFVAISLVVSSIMIGVITLISVLERTKEIGILRAVGASKKDISRVFNAETFIVGLCAGGIGIGGTLLLLIPINIILHKLTKVATLNAILPAGSAVVLIAISVMLTFISGLIPARSAAKKNPVEALRTE